MKTTFINQVRIGAKSTFQEVMDVLHWDDLQYANFQESMGYEYLKAEFGEGVPFVRELPYTAEFWAWWKNHWQKRDVLFLLEAEKLDLSNRVLLYRQYHSSEDFYFRPHRKILEKSYSIMIGKVIKQAVK